MTCSNRDKSFSSKALSIRAATLSLIVLNEAYRVLTPSGVNFLRNLLPETLKPVYIILRYGEQLSRSSIWAKRLLLKFSGRRIMFMLCTPAKKRRRLSSLGDHDADRRQCFKRFSAASGRYIRKSSNSISSSVSCSFAMAKMALRRNLAGRVPRIRSMCSIILPILTKITWALCLFEREREKVYNCFRYPVWLYSFVSPSADSRRAVVSYCWKYVHKVLVNRLGGLNLTRKSVVRLTDRPDMTLDVYRGRKTTNQRQQLCLYWLHSLPFLHVQWLRFSYLFNMAA